MPDVHFHNPGSYIIQGEISIRLLMDESMAGRFDTIDAALAEQHVMLSTLTQKEIQIMQALDDVKAQFADLQAKATNIENKADAAALVLTGIGQRLLDMAASATDLAALKDGMVNMGTELQARADNLGTAIDAVPPA